MSKHVPNRIAFIDTETLGSDKDTTKIIEIAIVLTDAKLNILQQKSWIVPRALTGVTITSIDPIVLKMHASNGLWEDLVNSNIDQSYDKLDAEILAWLSHQVGYNWQRVLVAGSGFDHFDRPIVNRLLPELSRKLTYYSLDIGSAERIIEIVGGIPIIEAHKTDHRAINCVLTQVERMRDYVGVMQRALGIPPGENVLLRSRATPSTDPST